MLKANCIYDTGKAQRLILMLILVLALLYFMSTLSTTAIYGLTPVLKATPAVDTTFTIIYPTN